MKRRTFILASSGFAGALVVPQVRAATEPCPPPQLTVGGITTTGVSCPAGTSALGALAASMAPGTWAQLTGTNQNAVIGSQLGNSGSLINYSSYFPWNPVAKRIEIVGSDHTGTAPGGKLPSSYARYNDATNAFSMAAVDDLLAPGGQVTPLHGGGHSQVDPFTGDLYHHKAFGSTSQFDVWKCPLGSSTFTRVGTTPSAYCQVLLGSCWWSGPFSGTSLGSRGAYMLYNSGACFNRATDGEIFVYDPTVGFKVTITGATPFAASSNASVMAYSAIHNCALYGGGDTTARKAFRLNSDGTHTNMPDVPGAGMGIDIGAIACDPVTGKFLLLSNGELWELNPLGSGTWTKQSGLRVPPSGVRNPTQMGQGMGLVSIPDYGVVAAISQISGSGGTFFLYKHA